jgi:hypothetical protein
MASAGLANAKTFAAKLSIQAWLLYGGFVVAAISTFLTCPVSAFAFAVQPRK